LTRLTKKIYLSERHTISKFNLLIGYYILQSSDYKIIINADCEIRQKSTTKIVSNHRTKYSRREIRVEGWKFNNHSQLAIHSITETIRENLTRGTERRENLNPSWIKIPWSNIKERSMRRNFPFHGRLHTRNTHAQFRMQGYARRNILNKLPIYGRPSKIVPINAKIPPKG